MPETEKNKKGCLPRQRANNNLFVVVSTSLKLLKYPESAERNQIFWRRGKVAFKGNEASSKLLLLVQHLWEQPEIKQNENRKMQEKNRKKTANNS